MLNETRETPIGVVLSLLLLAGCVAVQGVLMWGMSVRLDGDVSGRIAAARDDGAVSGMRVIMGAAKQGVDLKVVSMRLALCEARKLYGSNAQILEVVRREEVASHERSKSEE